MRVGCLRDMSDGSPITLTEGEIVVPDRPVIHYIESSHERYCSVGIMITRSGATLDWTLEMAD